MNALRRTPVRRKRSRPRRGRVIDRHFLAFIAAQPCLVSGERATVHHVRFCGSPRNDRRTIPLAPRFHMHDFGNSSIERLGKEKFEALHGVDIEAEIRRLNQEYERLFLHPPDARIEW